MSLPLYTKRRKLRNRLKIMRNELRAQLRHDRVTLKSYCDQVVLQDQHEERYPGHGLFKEKRADLARGILNLRTVIATNTRLVGLVEQHINTIMNGKADYAEIQKCLDSRSRPRRHPASYTGDPALDRARGGTSAGGYTG